MTPDAAVAQFPRPRPASRPDDTRRDRVYRMLQQAGERGVSAADFAAAEISMPWTHIESLVFEGHVIVQQTIAIRDHPNDRDVARRWFMRKDAWA